MLKDVKHVVVTGNVLRFWPHAPFRTNQVGNIEWLARLLAPIFHDHLVLGVGSLVWTEDSAFDSRKIYEAQGVPLSEEGYARLLSEVPCEEVCSYLRQHVGGALVVGFEIPDFLIKALLRAGIPYVDVMLAPWRFLPDLVFGIRTNDAEVFARIWEQRITDAEISSYAGLFRAKLSRFPRLELPDNSCVFAGQVGKDVSLLSKGKFLRLEEFEDRLSDLSERHSVLYFKEHPYCSPAERKAQRAFFNRFTNTRTIDLNIYYLMEQAGISSIYALTSSVTREASFFNKHGESLADYPFRFSQHGNFEPLGFAPVYGNLLQPAFWASLLDRELNGAAVTMPSGCLRDSLGMAWGADLNSIRALPWPKKWHAKLKRQLRRVKRRLGVTKP